MEIKKRLRQVYHWEYFWLCLLVVATLAMHFVIISRPLELVFDEQHYVTDARSILEGEGTLRAEHPPLAKLFIVTGILLFGDNPLGWRFFSIIFGTLCVVLFYLVCRRLSMSVRSSNLATFLLALDNLSFVQGSVAMLDVYSLVFMLGAFWLYLKESYLLSGVSVALSALAKLSGALALFVIVLHWLFAKRWRPTRQFVALLLITPLSFVLLMIPFDFIVSRYPVNPISRIETMLTLSSSLTFSTVTHEAASRPWDWLLRPNLMAYWYDPHYTAAISFTIWALIIPSALYMVFRAVKGNNAGLFGIAWFIGSYLVWIPLSLITDRISFVFYFYPTMGAVCIGLGLGLSQIMAMGEARKTGKLRWLVLAVPGYLLLHVAVFVILTPVFNLAYGKFWP